LSKKNAFALKKVQTHFLPSVILISFNLFFIEVQNDDVKIIDAAKI